MFRTLLTRRARHRYGAFLSDEESEEEYVEDVEVVKKQKKRQPHRAKKKKKKKNLKTEDEVEPKKVSESPKMEAKKVDVIKPTVVPDMKNEEEVKKVVEVKEEKPVVEEKKPVKVEKANSTMIQNLEKVARMENMEQVLEALNKFVPMSDSNMNIFLYESNALQILLKNVLTRRPPIQLDVEIQKLFAMCLKGQKDVDGKSTWCSSVSIISLFVCAFQLCHSNYKNIAHSYRKKITRKSTLEHRYSEGRVTSSHFETSFHCGHVG